MLPVRLQLHGAGTARQRLLHWDALALHTSVLISRQFTSSDDDEEDSLYKRQPGEPGYKPYILAFEGSCTLRKTSEWYAAMVDELRILRGLV